MEFRIQYCKLCGYQGRAEELASELRDRFGVEASVEEGLFGQFDVRMDGEVVASRGQTFIRRMVAHGAPSPDEVLASIERHLAVSEGDACALPEARASQTKPEGS